MTREIANLAKAEHLLVTLQASVEDQRTRLQAAADKVTAAVNPAHELTWRASDMFEASARVHLTKIFIDSIEGWAKTRTEFDREFFMEIAKQTIIRNARNLGSSRSTSVFSNLTEDMLAKVAGELLGGYGEWEFFRKAQQLDSEYVADEKARWEKHRQEKIAADAIAADKLARLTSKVKEVIKTLALEDHKPRVMDATSNAVYIPMKRIYGQDHKKLTEAFENHKDVIGVYDRYYDRLNIKFREDHEAQAKKNAEIVV